MLVFFCAEVAVFAGAKIAVLNFKEHILRLGEMFIDDL